MELLLIRHAEPVRIAAGEAHGQPRLVDAASGVSSGIDRPGRSMPADPGLTARGADQAERLAAWLAADGVDVIATSPLRRARETAAPLADALGLEPMVVEGISEYDAHSDEYIPIEELRALKDERWQATIEGRWVDVGGVDPREFQQQVVPAIDDLIAQHPGQTVAAFSHGGVVNVYLAHLLGIDRLLWFHPEYTSISRVHAARTGPKSVATVNETAHLVATRQEPKR